MSEYTYGGSYTRTPEQIIRLYRDRQKARGTILEKMAALRDQYNGDIVVPLPELDKNEKASVANLVQQGLDNYGSRVASVLPNLTCPPVDPRSSRAMAKADIRRKATMGWWEDNRVSMQMRRRARFLLGYGTQGVQVRPDLTSGIPKWELRNPLGLFTTPTNDPADITPADGIYAYERPFGWIRRMYPQAAARLKGMREVEDTKAYTVLEYDDAEQITCLVVGDENAGTYQGGAPYVILASAPNRAECPLTVIGGRVTLDRISGQFDGVLGMFQMQAQLMAMEVLAVRRGVFPDTYLVSRPNETATFIEGPHPGHTGKVNIVEGGDIKEFAPQPGFATTQTVDRLERAQRLTGGIPSDFGGESGTNIRTGRRGDQVLSATVDFPIQEAQEVLAACLEEENYRATKIAKAYFGNTPKSFHVRTKGYKGVVTYTPNKDFDSDYSMVTYAMAGADVQNVTIGVGQLVGTGLMAKTTARKLHPWVQDAELEGDLVVAEGLEQAMLQGLQTQAASGQIPPADVAAIMRKVEQDNISLADAIQQVHEEAQKRQASSGPPGTPEGPVEPTSPEAQPGIAQPGMGAEAGATIPAPAGGLDNLGMLLRSLRGSTNNGAR